ncbi:MAG: MFS transporter, partial [Actinomycetota bacterium]|nr:MFS transporter [Actinomycetota bacterium]
MSVSQADVTLRTAQVRRNTALLVLAQIGLWAALASFAAFGPGTVDELTKNDTAVGGVLAAYYAALAPGAILAGRMMDRRGRRPGLIWGYAAVSLSGVISIVAAATGSVVGSFVAAIVLGAGAGAALLGRAAVADMYEPERRGRAIGMVVMAGTIGAVAGAPLAGGAAAAARALGVSPSLELTAPWLLVPLFGIVALLAVRALRPDPRDLAVAGRQSGGRSPREVLRGPEALRALVAISVIQAVMVAFMGVFPVVLRRAETAPLIISIVVGVHLAAMFAPSQAIGVALDRFGRRPVLAVSSAVTMVGVLLEMVSPTPLVGG